MVEQDGAIVGCHVLFYALHAECLWIDPRFRGKPSVARRLWTAVQRAVRATGEKTLITGAMDDRVRGLLAHVGAVRLPGEQYAIPMGAK